jgi:hypothetical protein
MGVSAFGIACVSYLTLRLCLALIHSLGTKSFYLEHSLSFLISSGHAFCFYLALDHLNEFSLSSNHLCVGV